MSEVDERLYRAARRLREMPVEVPDLADLGIAALPAQQCPQRERRPALRMPALLAAGLLAIGALAGVAAITRGTSVDVESNAAPARTAADRQRDPLVVAPPRTSNPLDDVTVSHSARPAPALRAVVRWS